MNPVFFHRILILFLCFSGLLASGQNHEDAIELSGNIVDSGTLTPLPSTTLRHSRKAYPVDSLGRFSIYVKRNDTLSFSHIGYRPANIIIPDTIDQGYDFQMMIFMYKDTVTLQEVTILPWRFPGEFKNEFINLKTTAPKEEVIARHNLKMINYYARHFSHRLPWTPEDVQRYNLNAFIAQMQGRGSLILIDPQKAVIAIIHLIKSETEPKGYRYFKNEEMR